VKPGSQSDERADVVRKAKEFFYVDLQRVRSYYAQLNRGVVESVVLRDANLKVSDLQATLLGFGPRVGVQADRSREESRSLQDPGPRRSLDSSRLSGRHK
jgi:hypothetical protein